MAVVGELVTLFLGNNTQLLASAAQSQAAMEGYASSSATAFSAIATGATAVGAVAVVGMGLGVRAAADFQDQMAIINTISHQTPAALAETGAAIRALSVTSGTGLDDLTQAFYDLVSAGIPVAQAMSVLGQANTLAIGGMATTSQTVDLLTTAINAYQLNAAGAALATDQFAQAIALGKVTADEIASTFSGIAPLARSAGIGIDEIAATYGFLTAQGSSAGEAMTQMQRAMIELQKPNATLIALQNKLGVNFADIARQKGLVGALEQMRVAAAGAGVPFQNLFGRIEGLNFALATTGSGFAGYEAALTSMATAGGAAASQAGERMETFNRQTAILGASLNDLAITVGTGLLPPLTAFVQSISASVQAAQAWAEASPRIASAILPVIAAVSGLIVAATSMNAIMGLVATTVAVITNPILLAVGAIGLLGAHFGLLGDDAKGAVDGFIATVIRMVPQVVAELGELGGQVASWISSQAPIILAQVQTWAGAFVAWISPLAAQAAARLGQMAAQVGSWVQAQAPSWLAQLEAWGQAFLEWIHPMIPKALSALGDLVGRGIAWVAAQAPSWLAALLRWADQFMGWVAPMIPKLLGALGEFGGQLVSWVLQQIPVIAAALGQLAIQFVAWVLPQIPVLLVGLGQLAVELVAWIARQIPVIAGAVIGWGQSLYRWILDSIPGALSSLATWLVDVLAWFASIPGQIYDAALKLGNEIGRGIVDGIGNIPEAIKNSILGPSVPVETFMQQFEATHGRRPTPLEFGQFQAGTLPGFANGGVVPGFGPQLAIVHGGERITPAGRGDSSQPMNIHVTVQVGEEKFVEWIERRLYDRATGYSSGFSPASVGG